MFGNCPKCKKPLPSDLLDEFRCMNCGKTKHISEVGKTSFSARLFFIPLVPKMTKICKSCRYQPAAFIWFTLVLALLLITLNLYSK